MELNKPAVIKLFNEHFNGNFSKFARALGVDVSYVYRVIEKEKNCGVKFYTSVIRWCQENNMDYREFILLP
jgi:hypothetical protein